MTGMETAKLFLAHNLGILRTMPAPDERSLREFRTRAAALGHPWEEDIDYGEFLRQLDTTDPHQLAVMHAAGSLFRGAGYLALPAASEDGTPVEPDEKALAQAAIGAPYTHTTAPLRRLVDRFVLLTAEHLANGRPLPEDLRQALPLLPELIKSSNQRTGQIERAAVDLVEAGARRVRLAIRTMPHIVQRTTLGWPAQATGMLVRHLPASSRTWSWSPVAMCVRLNPCSASTASSESPRAEAPVGQTRTQSKVKPWARNRSTSGWPIPVAGVRTPAASGSVSPSNASASADWPSMIAVPE